MNDARRGRLAAAGAAVLFGSSFVATAFALRLLGPLAVGAWRGAVAALIVGIVLLRGSLAGRAELARLDRPGRLRLIALGCLGGPVFIGAMNIAVGEAGATITAFAAGLYAVLAALLGPLLLRERLGRMAVLAFAIALGGTALLADIDPGAGNGSRLAGGVLVALGGAISFALYLVLTRRWGRAWPLPGSLVALANFGATAVVLVPAALLVEHPPAAVASSGDVALAVVALGWLIVGPSVAAQLLLVMSVHRLPARESGTYLLLNPLAATGLAALLLGERLSAAQLLGAGLVLVAMALATGLPGRLAALRSGRAGATDVVPDDAQGPSGGSAATR